MDELPVEVPKTAVRGRRSRVKKPAAPGQGLSVRSEEMVKNAWMMRLAGASWPMIAGEVGYSSTAACQQAVKRFLERTEEEELIDSKQTHLARLNQLLLGCWGEAQGGSVSHIGVALQIIREINQAEEGINVNVHHDGIPQTQVMIIGGAPDMYLKRLQELAASSIPALPAVTMAGVSELNQMEIIDAVLVEDEKEE